MDLAHNCRWPVAQYFRDLPRDNSGICATDQRPSVHNYITGELSAFTGVLSQIDGGFELGDNNNRANAFGSAQSFPADL